jgi:hypothetical protein
MLPDQCIALSETQVRGTHCSERTCAYRIVAFGLIGVLFHAAVGIPANAHQVIFTALKDTPLYETADGSISNGDGSAMFAGRNSQSPDSGRRAFLGFDVATNIPAGSMINKVHRTMCSDGVNDQDDAITLRRVASIPAVTQGGVTVLGLSVSTTGTLQILRRKAISAPPSNVFKQN